MKKVLSGLLSAAVFAGCIGAMPAVVPAAETGDVWRFDFGPVGQTTESGYYSVTPETEYNSNEEDGLRFGLYGQNENDYKLKNHEDGVTAKKGQYYTYTAAGSGSEASDDRIGIGELPEGQIDGLYPIRFSMAAENNGYYSVKVYVTTLDESQPAESVNVYSERRHPIVTDKTIAAGETELVEFTATVQSVLVKDRTAGGTITYDDDKLNVMVVGENAAISSIEVEKIEPATTIWCYDDSTGCDYPMVLPYFPLQNYGGTAQYLSKYLPKDVALVNQGDGGIAANAMSYFNLCKENIKAGDYIYLQYGHNHKNDGPAGYVQYLAEYYEWAHSKGAYMVYVGPIDRHNSSQYDSGTNTWSSTLSGFSKAARYYTELLICGGIDLAKEFAAKVKEEGGTSISDAVYEWADGKIAEGITGDGAKDVAFIDLNAPTLEWLSEVCEEVRQQKGETGYSSKYSDYYFRAQRGTSVDGTHENDYGADATASFFFDGIKALVDKEDKTPIETVQANVLAPLVDGMREAKPDKVSEEIVKAGAAPNDMYPKVFQSSDIAELPVEISSVEWDDDNTISEVTITKQESRLSMDSYGKLELVIRDAGNEVKGTIFSTQVDNTWDDGSVNIFSVDGETNRLTGDIDTVYDEDAGDTFTAVVYKALDDEDEGLIFDETSGARIAYSDPYVETEVIAALVPNEDGEETENFNFYGVTYDGTRNIHGVNNWAVYGSSGGKDTTLHEENGRYYTNVIKDSNSTSFALSRKLSESVGTEGRVSVSVDLRTTGLGNMNIGLANQGTQFPDQTMYIISVDADGNVYAYGNNEESAAVLSTTEWTTVNAELDIDLGTITVTVGDNTVTSEVPAYRTTSVDVVPSSLSHMHIGMNTSNQPGGIQVSNLKVLKLRSREDLPVYTMEAVSDNESYGTVSCSTNGGEINTLVTVKAEPKAGMSFVNWKDSEGNIVSEEAEYTFRLRGNTSLRGCFGNNAVINAVDESGEVIQTIGEASGVPGEEYKVSALPQVIEKDGVFYELQPDGSGERTYTRSFTMGSDGDEIRTVTYARNEKMVYFAEAEEHKGNASSSGSEASNDENYSSGKAFRVDRTNLYSEYSDIELESDGYYTISIAYEGRDSNRSMGIHVDGEQIGTHATSGTERGIAAISLYLKAGTHTLQLRTSYNLSPTYDYVAITAERVGELSSYTVNAVDEYGRYIGELANGVGFIGDELTENVTAIIQGENGICYKLDDDTVSEFKKQFTINGAEETVNVSYKTSEDNIVYYVEDIANASVSDTASGGMRGYVSGGSCAELATLPAGTYKFVVRYISDGNRNFVVRNMDSTLTAENNTLLSFINGNSEKNTEIVSDELILTEETTVGVSGYTNTQGRYNQSATIDYVYIIRTGVPAPSPVPAPTEAASPSPTATASPEATEAASPSPTATASPEATEEVSPSPTATASPDPEETEKPYPYTITECTVENGVLTVTTAGDGKPREAVMFVAYYDRENRLAGIRLEDVTETENEFVKTFDSALPDGAERLKVIIWDKNTQAPYAKLYETEL